MLLWQGPSCSRMDVVSSGMSVDDFGHHHHLLIWEGLRMSYLFIYLFKPVRGGLQ